MLSLIRILVSRVFSTPIAARLVTYPLVCYVGVLISMVTMQDTLVFHPKKASEWWLDLPPNRNVNDIELHTESGTRLHAWWFPHDGSTGAMLFLHGNGANLSFHYPLASLDSVQRELRESILVVDYPGFGRSEGTASEEGCYAAADAAYDWLTRDQRISPERILIVGQSLGSGVAVDLASRKECRALVLISPYTSIPDVGEHLMPMFPIRLLSRNSFDSLAKIRRCDRPLFIVHGTGDPLIPFQQGQSLYHAARAPKRLLPINNAGHVIRLDVDILAELRRFLGEASRSDLVRS